MVKAYHKLPLTSNFGELQIEGTVGMAAIDDCLAALVLPGAPFSLLQGIFVAPLDMSTETFLSPGEMVLLLITLALEGFESIAGFN